MNEVWGIEEKQEMKKNANIEVKTNKVIYKIKENVNKRADGYINEDDTDHRKSCKVEKH